MLVMPFCVFMIYYATYMAAAYGFRMKWTSTLACQSLRRLPLNPLIILSLTERRRETVVLMTLDRRANLYRSASIPTQLRQREVVLRANCAGPPRSSAQWVAAA